MTALDPTHATELARVLDELTPLQLTTPEWASIEAELAAVSTEGNPAVDRLAQVVFEAKIQSRFRGGRAASTLPPTKKVSILPWVGLVCGALLLAVGGALGGGYVLAGVALLSLGVFAVAFAGSRVAHRRVDGTDGEASDPVEAMPAAVAAHVETWRQPRPTAHPEI